MVKTPATGTAKMAEMMRQRYVSPVLTVFVRYMIDVSRSEKIDSAFAGAATMWSSSGTYGLHVRRGDTPQDRCQSEGEDPVQTVDGLRKKTDETRDAKQRYIREEPSWWTS